MKKIFFLFISILTFSGINAQKILSHTEDFIKYDNKWYQAESDSCSLIVTDGMYKISRKISDEHSIFSVENIYINQDKDFTIEARIIHTGGSENQKYGITWGYQDINNYFSFGITSNGNYEIVKREKGLLVQYKELSNFQGIKHENNDYNILRVDKTGKNCLFYINDSLAAQILFEPFFGQKVGFEITGNQSIEIDYLNIYQEPVNSVVGIEIPVTMKNILNESFKDNSKDWGCDCATGSFSIKDGKAIFKGRAIGQCCMIYISSGIHSESDFIIEVNIEKKDGFNDSNYGIMWGPDGLDDHYEFLIDPDGNYTLYKNYDATSIDQINSQVINVKNAPNKLTISKNKDKVVFYINGKYLNTTEYQPSMFDNLGFVVCNPVTIEFDDLEVWQSNP